MFQELFPGDTGPEYFFLVLIPILAFALEHWLNEIFGIIAKCVHHTSPCCRYYKRVRGHRLAYLAFTLGVISFAHSAATHGISKNINLTLITLFFIAIPIMFAMIIGILRLAPRLGYDTPEAQSLIWILDCAGALPFVVSAYLITYVIAQHA